MGNIRNANILWQDCAVSSLMRAEIKKQNPVVFWFTGLPGSGKSTMASCLESFLHGKGYHTMLLDGDNVRHGLCQDLQFSTQDRQENIRRIAEVVKLFLDAGIIVITAFISPFISDRQNAKHIVGKERFFEIHCDSSLQICENRDPKGHYKKAREGLIKEFTGISSPYEIPENPSVAIDTAHKSIDASFDELSKKLSDFKIILHDTA